MTATGSSYLIEHTFEPRVVAAAAACTAGAVNVQRCTRPGTRTALCTNASLTRCSMAHADALLATDAGVHVAAFDRVVSLNADASTVVREQSTGHAYGRVIAPASSSDELLACGTTHSHPTCRRLAKATLAPVGEPWVATGAVARTPTASFRHAVINGGATLVSARNQVALPQSAGSRRDALSAVQLSDTSQVGCPFVLLLLLFTYFPSVGFDSGTTRTTRAPARTRQKTMACFAPPVPSGSATSTCHSRALVRNKGKNEKRKKEGK